MPLVRYVAKFSLFQITIDIQSVSSCTCLSESVHWRFIASETRETGVPFWVNLVSASAPSLPTRIALFTLRSAIEFSFLFEISHYVLRLQYDFAAKTLQGRHDDPDA